MSRGATVDCCVTYAKSSADSQSIRFSTGRHLRLHLQGRIGPNGLSARASDLLDLGAAVFQIERQFRSRSVGNPPVRLQLAIKLREPQAWNRDARESLTAILSLLGNSIWDVELKSGLQEKTYRGNREGSSKRFSQVALLSGGLDSTCTALGYVTIRFFIVVPEKRNYGVLTDSREVAVKQRFALSITASCVGEVRGRIEWIQLVMTIAIFFGIFVSIIIVVFVIVTIIIILEHLSFEL